MDIDFDREIFLHRKRRRTHDVHEEPGSMSMTAHVGDR